VPPFAFNSQIFHITYLLSESAFQGHQILSIQHEKVAFLRGGNGSRFPFKSLQTRYKDVDVTKVAAFYVLYKGEVERFCDLRSGILLFFVIN